MQALTVTSLPLERWTEALFRNSDDVKVVIEVGWR
jgi:hypothetical protein